MISEVTKTNTHPKDHTLITPPPNSLICYATQAPPPSLVYTPLTSDWPQVYCGARSDPLLTAFLRNRVRHL